MKKMFKIFMLLAMGGFLFAACSDPEPTPEPPVIPTDPVNEFRFEGASTPIRSLVVDHLVKQDVYTIVLSPDAGLATYEDATSKNNGTYTHPFFQLEIPASSAASFRVDMLNPGNKVFRFENNARVAADVSVIAPGSTGTLKSGEMSVVSDGKKMTVRFKLTLSDDRVLDGHYEGAYTLPEEPEEPTKPTSYYDYNGTVAEFKSMAIDYQAIPGSAYILLSPVKGLTTFAEFTKQDDRGIYVNEFCGFVLPNESVADVQIDVKNPGDHVFSFMNQMQVFTDVGQIKEDMTVLVTEGAIRTKVENGVLKLDANFTAMISGDKITFHGECAYTQPEQPEEPEDPDNPTAPGASYYEYNGAKSAFKSMAVDYQAIPGSAYIMLSPVEGLTTFAEFTKQDDRGIYVNEFCGFVLPNDSVTDVQIDVKNPGDHVFSFINQMQVFTDVGTVSETMTVLVTEGAIRSKVENGVLKLDANFTAMISGDKIVFHGECAYQAPV